MIKHQLKIFFTALMFFTRIPCPAFGNHSPEYLNKATRYFPLIGWIVGALTYGVYFVCTSVFNDEISVILSIITGILVTGAFHEDGFADVCDGFGGGWTKLKILEIMKDSRVGAYGVIGLLLILMLKFYLLLQIIRIPGILVFNPFVSQLIVFIAAHAISRLAAATIVFTNQYVQEDLISKSKPIARNYSWKEVTGAFIFGIFPLFLLSIYHIWFLIVLIPIGLSRFYLAYYYKKWIGGYTGDCLGATQQISEMVFYLLVIGIWKFI